MSMTVLDGGMGRELERIGAPFRQPEWSALALLEGPDWVIQAHRNFIEAGAHVITTNSYACVPFHLGEERFAAHGHRLAALAGTLARTAASSAPAVSTVRVAGSLPPVFGSYRPDLFDAGHVGALLDVLVDGLAPSVDHWLIETTASIAEAVAALRAVSAVASRPRWVSFTLDDDLAPSDTRGEVAVLRSGESISDAITACGGEIDAVLFNCSPPEVMAAAVEEAARTLSRLGSEARIGVYANAFAEIDEDSGANETLHGIRTDLTPNRYSQFAQDWADRGATIIGGCCGISPDHISHVAIRFATASS
jgi:S-methylmethionine-dependent homocysteine/selenocysteine methylase